MSKSKRIEKRLRARLAEYEKNRENGISPKIKKSTVWSRFCKNKVAVFGLVLFAVMAIIALTAGLYIDYDEDVVYQHISEAYQSPSSEHILGTDSLGRDLFARIIYGARISLFVGLGTVIGSLILGSIIGAAAAYYGGSVDNILMRIMDVLLAIPNTLFAICIIAAFGLGMTKMILALMIAGIPRFSRIVRSAVMGVKGEEYIEAAKACGTSDSRIIMRHIIPNAMGAIIVQTTTQVARTILTISSLSFVGLGISPPTPEWGSMLAEARPILRQHPYLVILPGIAIMLTTLSLYSIGDGLRDALDPRLRK